jgi:hypothetical protein
LKMRAVGVFLSLLALADGAADAKTTGKCLVYGSDAVSEAMDAAMYMWAAIDRCGKASEEIKCSVGILSTVESMNAMVNVILRSMEMCGDLEGVDYQCGMAVSHLTKASAGTGAAAANIAQHCETPGATNAGTASSIANGNWPQQDPAQCIVDLKDSLHNVFKAFNAFLKIPGACAAGHTHCVANGLRMSAAVGAMGAYLAGAVGHCSPPNSVHGSVCAEGSLMLIKSLEEIGQAGIQISEHCGKASTRLYELEHEVKAQPSVASPLNIILAAFIPVAAVVSFVGGRHVSKQGHVQVREFASDSETD